MLLLWGTIGDSCVLDVSFVGLDQYQLFHGKLLIYFLVITKHPPLMTS